MIRNISREHNVSYVTALMFQCLWATWTEYLSISDKVCHPSTYQNYGVSADQGVNRLKGPGVYEAPGAAHMGGRIPFRLTEMCETFREADDSKIYNVWLRSGRVHHGLQRFLCFNKELKGEEGTLDLNLCGRKGSEHAEKLHHYEQEKRKPPQPLPQFEDALKDEL